MDVILQHHGKTFNRLHFKKGPINIGRSRHNQIFLPDMKVSRQHAVIYSTGYNVWNIEDLNSTNKTFLNDKEIHKEQLKDGDIIKIADFLLQIKIKEKALQLQSQPKTDKLTKVAL
jgi:pSer/pThr/pTyr-binding forkhead associated (FHA) protein